MSCFLDDSAFIAFIYKVILSKFVTLVMAMGFCVTFPVICTPGGTPRRMAALEAETQCQYQELLNLTTLGDTMMAATAGSLVSP